MSNKFTPIQQITITVETNGQVVQLRNEINGFFQPIASADGMMPVLDLMEEIKEKYGLPIDIETIDAHFNRERPEQTAADYAKNFYQVLKHIQVLLSSRLQGDIDVDEVLSAVFEAVDNQNINAAIREYEKSTNGRNISL